MQKLTQNDIQLVFRILKINAENTQEQLSGELSNLEYQLGKLHVERVMNIADKLYAAIEHNDKRITIE